MKTDDDVYINFPVLMKLLDRYANATNSILGRLLKRSKPYRDPQSHYFVTKEEYSGEYYPKFTAGPGYVMTNDVIERMYFASLEQPYLKLEDVFITGIVASKLNATLLDQARYYHIWPKGSLNACSVKKLFAVHNVKPEKTAKLWSDLIFSEQLKC